jgi:hypothetical protein
MVIGRAAALFVAAFASGCVRDPGPRDTLAAYREALLRKDAEAIAKLEASSLRADHDIDAIRAQLLGHPELASSLARELGEDAEIETAELVLESGRRVRLVRESGAWRVLEGGIDRSLPATAIGALSGFFGAIDRDRMDELRSFIPDEHQATFAQESALRAHVQRERERIAKVRAALGPLEAKEAIVSGDEAEVPYGEGKSVRMLRQGGTWRVIDLE